MMASSPRSAWVPRRRRVVGLLLVSILLFGSGCADAWLGDASSDDPRAVFDAYWHEFDRYYAAFALKEVDWDGVRRAYRPAIGANTSDRELFEALSAATATLRDGHANVYTPVGDYRYTGWFEAYPENFDPDRQRRTVRTLQTVSSALETGTLASGIGYIRVRSFGRTESEYANIDEIVARMADRSGIVIDVRQNGGGATARVRQVIRPFVSTEATYAHVRWRNGPARDDLTAYRPQDVAPERSDPYDRPVVVVTNRRCFSACEMFVLMMRSQPHVTVVGDTTGGGSGGPTYRDLPNGWRVRIPRWVAYTAKKEPFEGRGLYPDVPVGLRTGDPVDTMLRRAADVIQSRK